MMRKVKNRSKKRKNAIFPANLVFHSKTNFPMENMTRKSRFWFQKLETTKFSLQRRITKFPHFFTPPPRSIISLRPQQVVPLPFPEPSVAAKLSSHNRCPSTPTRTSSSTSVAVNVVTRCPKYCVISPNCLSKLTASPSRS